MYAERRIYWRADLLVIVPLLLGWAWWKSYQERIELSPKHFSLSQKVMGYAHPEVFDLNRVSNFRPIKWWLISPIVPARLQFDFDSDFWGADSRSFGWFLYGDEARNLIKAIQAYQAANRTSSKAIDSTSSLSYFGIRKPWDTGYKNWDAENA